MAVHKIVNVKTKAGQIDPAYNFGQYKIVIENSATGELQSVRPRKVYWGPNHERLMQFSKNVIAVLKKMDVRSFPEKTYRISSLRIA